MIMQAKELFFLEKEKELNSEMRRKNLSIKYTKNQQKRGVLCKLTDLQKELLERVLDQELKLAVYINNGDGKVKYRLLNNKNSFLTKTSQKINRHTIAALLRKGFFILEKKEEKYNSYVFYRYRFNEKKYLELIKKNDSV